MADKISVNTALKIGSIAHSVWRDSRQDSEADRNRSHYRRIYASDEARVCLTCTRKHCNGGEDCFASRKKEMREKP